MKYLPSLALLLALPLGGPGCTPDTAETTTVADQALTTEINGTFELPIPEASGLGRRTIDGKDQYLAVGDSLTTLATFDVQGGNATNIKKVDLSRLISGTSQWEAVAGDKSGKVFILAEASDTITVLDRSLSRVIQAIRLVIPPSHPLHESWYKQNGDHDKDVDAKANSRGEGMVLLANGHILVAKEKSPVAIVEFAPEGEQAAGYAPALALNAEFPIVEGPRTTMSAVKHWVLKEGDTKAIGDVSELATDAQGRLVLLTDQGRAIVTIEKGLRTDEGKMDVKNIYKMPSKVEKPEGLIFAGGVPFVAIDLPKVGKTLFALDALK